MKEKLCRKLKEILESELEELIGRLQVKDFSSQKQYSKFSPS